MFNLATPLKRVTCWSPYEVRRLTTYSPTARLRYEKTLQLFQVG